MNYRIKGTEIRHVRHLEMLPQTCSLDVADWDGATLLQVGEILNLTRERVRQIEVAAIIKLGCHRDELGMLVPSKE